MAGRSCYEMLDDCMDDSIRLHESSLQGNEEDACLLRQLLDNQIQIMRVLQKLHSMELVIKD